MVIRAMIYGEGAGKYVLVKKWFVINQLTVKRVLLNNNDEFEVISFQWKRK
jgi:hypothetical protein